MKLREVGEKISGLYVDTFPYVGTIVSRRPKYGRSMEYTVELDAPIEVFGDVREIILISEGE